MVRFYPMPQQPQYFQPDVTTQVFTPLRAHAQTVPNLTLYIDAGAYNLRGRHFEWNGGNSSAFTPPVTAGYLRIDVLYLDWDGFHVSSGVEVPNYFSPVAPTLADGVLYVCEVKLYTGQTSILNSDIFYDPREFLSVGQGIIETWVYANAAARTGATGFVANDVGRVAYQQDTQTYWRLTAITPTWLQVAGLHSLLGSLHSDTLTDSVVAGDIIIGNATPKWARLPANSTATKKYLQSVSSGLASWQQVDYADLSGTPTIPTGANPTTNIDGSVHNGVAATWMRSDAAPKLADTTVSPATYGDATHAGQFTVDQQGRITSASNIVITGVPPATHDMISAHSYTGGANLDVFGLSAPNTIARLTPSSDVTAGTSAILASNAGALKIKNLTVAENSNESALIVKASASQTNANPLIVLQKSDGTALTSIHSDDSTNIFIGLNAGKNNSVGAYPAGAQNFFMGSGAGQANTSGYYNVAIGGNALHANTTGYRNFALGYQALLSAVSLNYNVAIGDTALQDITTGALNCAIGGTALQVLTSGSFNIAIGGSAGGSLQSGNYNTFIGEESGYNTLNADHNIFIGYKAGNNETGGSKLFIDSFARASEADGRVKALVYGVFATTPAAQTLTNNSVVNINPQFTASGINTVLTLDTQGSGANSDGGALSYLGKTSTTASVAMGLDQWLWVNATHASRTARRVFNVYDTAAREALRMEASGSAPMLGFFGHAAAVQPAAYTVSNPTANRSLDETNVTLTQLAQIVGTLIQDVQTMGLVG